MQIPTISESCKSLNKMLCTLRKSYIRTSGKSQVFDLYSFRPSLLLSAELLVLPSQGSLKLNNTNSLHKLHRRANMANALVDDWYPGM